MRSTFLQTTRPLTIKTALPADTFVVMSIEGREAISELYRFEVELMTENRNSVAFHKLLGDEATVSQLCDNGRETYFSGIVCAVEQGENMVEVQDDGLHEYTRFRISVVPKAWLLSQRQRSRIFQRQTVPDILKAVLKDSNADFHLDQGQEEFEPRDYCVQYRETDLQFAKRLMEEEGIFFFFQHADRGHRMIVANASSSFAALPDDFRFETMAPETGAEDRIFAWRKTQQIRPGKYTLRDYSFEVPEKSLEESKETQATVEVGSTTHKLTAGGGSSLEIYDYPGGYAGKYDGIGKDGGGQYDPSQKINAESRKVAAQRMQAEAVAALQVAGRGSAKAFRSGSSFQLQHHFCDDGHFVITSVQHSSRQTIGINPEVQPFEYHNQFTCIPAGLPFRPQRVTPVPVVHGTHTATVVGPAGEDIFTDKYGRVKVQFRWDRDGQADSGSSCWIRVATTWAGKSWGAIHIPRVGQEVVVAFEEGDPNQPIIIGSVYNASQMPPYALPDNKTQSGIRSHSTPNGSGSNELRFEDKQGSEQIFLHAEKDLLSTIEHDETRNIKRDRTTDIVGNETKVVRQGDEKITLQQGNQSTAISLGKSEMEAMQSIELKVGQSSIKLDQTGVTIKGLTVKIEGQVQVQVKGTITQINGDALLIQKGGIVMIN